jgi:cellulose synthase/poly-beta-1,6-N-acetylglucosamine synthase-like glycosyltransferase
MALEGTSIIFYIIVFFALYIQVFFLYYFFTRKKTLQEESIYVASDSELPTVTLIIPCWNESETIGGTMESVKNLDYPKEKLHTILIDDGSSDNTWEILQEYKDWSNTVVMTKENGGKHTALNHAMKSVETDLICSIDADTFLEPDALAKAASYFVRKPELSAVGGAVLINDPKTFAQKAQSIEYQMFAYSKKVLGFLDGVMVAPGAFSLYRTEALHDVGGYRKAHNMEDLELTFRLQTAGHKVDQCHNGIVYTKGPDTVKGLFKQRMRWGYGLLKNTMDYKDAMFNRKFGNFGLFTMPMSIFAYFLVLVMFFVSWYKIFEGLISQITIAKLTGGVNILASIASFDWFFINTQAIVMLTAATYLTIFMSIYFGRKISSVTGGPYINFLWFFVLYSVIVPFWVIKSTYNAIVASTPSWR